METVNFLAQWWGFSLILISLAFLLKQKYADYIFGWMEDPKNVLVFGIINILLGVALVLSYNAWVGNWTVIITLLGWLTIIKGIGCLFFPDTVKIYISKLKQRQNWVSLGLVVGVLLGCILIYCGASI